MPDRPSILFPANEKQENQFHPHAKTLYRAPLSGDCPRVCARFGLPFFNPWSRHTNNKTLLPTKFIRSAGNEHRQGSPRLAALPAAFFSLPPHLSSLLLLPPTLKIDLKISSSESALK